MDSTSVGKGKPSRALAGLVGPFTKIARAMSKRYDVEVVPTGLGARTDGMKIYIPFTADFLPEAARDALHGKLDHEVAHVVEEREAKEAGRESPIEVFSREKNATIRMLLNCYEDVRIERKAAARYPGVAENLKSNREFNLKAMRANPELWNNFWHRLGCCIVIDCGGKGDLDWVDAPTLFYFEAISEIVEEARAGIRSVQHAHDLAIRTYELVKKLYGDRDRGKGPGGEETSEGEDKGHGTPNDDEEGAAESDEGEEESGGAGADEDEDAEGSGGSEEDEDAEDDESSGDGEKGESKIPDMDPGEATLEDLNKAGEKALEKMVRDDAEKHQRYVPNPASVARDIWRKAPVAENGEQRFFEIEREYSPIIGALRQKLMMATQSRARKRICYGLESGNLDDGVLAEVRTGNKRVFHDLEEGTFLNTAILTLFDLSGSTHPDNSDAACCSYYELRTGVILAKSFEVLNIPSAFHGWHNHPGKGTYCHDNLFVNRSPFEHFIFKGFNERLRATRGRFASIYGRMENADGEAVLENAKILARRPERRKILMVVSDGMPADRCSHIRLEKHLIEVIKRVSEAGIEVVGIGAGTEEPKKFYNEKNGASFLHVKDFKTLPLDVFRLFYNRMREVRK